MLTMIHVHKNDFFAWRVRVRTKKGTWTKFLSTFSDEISRLFNRYSLHECFPSVYYLYAKYITQPPVASVKNITSVHVRIPIFCKCEKVGSPCTSANKNSQSKLVFASWAVFCHYRRMQGPRTVVPPHAFTGWSAWTTPTEHAQPKTWTGNHPGWKDQDSS